MVIGANLYEYLCTGCSYRWSEERTEVSKNVPRYSPCPSCKVSENIEILGLVCESELDESKE